MKCWLRGVENLGDSLTRERRLTSSPSQEYLDGIEPLFAKLVLVIFNLGLLEKDVIAAIVPKMDKVVSKRISFFMKMQKKPYHNYARAGVFII